MATETRVAVPGTKERIVNSSAELFRRQGYTGTGLKQIVAAADAPFGSLYHFFPGGKEQLAEEVIRVAGRFYLQLFEAISGEAPDVAAATSDFFTGAA
jgi:AcrR family transcriptional regulator